MRLFIAIELPAELRSRLAVVIAGLERQTPTDAVRWVRPDGIHLTLKFLGEAPEAHLSPIQSIMESVGRGAAPFTFAVSGVGCYPNVRQPRVVWAGVSEPSGGLQRLHKMIEDGMARLGYPPETRPFSPHLTLGRLVRNVRPPDARRIGEVTQSAAVGDVGMAAASDVSLMKSDLQPSGAVYSRIGKVKLEG